MNEPKPLEPRDIMSETPRTDAVRKGSGGAGRFVELCEVLERELTQAQARGADLEKDAARYRWFRDNEVATYQRLAYWQYISADEFDAKIDAALKEKR